MITYSDTATLVIGDDTVSTDVANFSSLMGESTFKGSAIRLVNGLVNLFGHRNKEQSPLLSLPSHSAI